MSTTSISLAKATTAIAPDSNLTSPNTLKDSIEFVLKAERGQDAVITENSRVNEDQLYAAVAHQKLKEAAPKAATKLEQNLAAYIKNTKTTHGKPFVFKATDRMMRQMINSGELTQEQYRQVRDFAFGKAQLDGDRTDLSRERIETSGKDSPQREIDTALKKFETNSIATPDEINQFKIKESKRGASIKSTAQVSASELPSGFLWKPVSDSDGRLVVLLPTSFIGNTNGVSLLDPDTGKTLASGRYSGIGNGMRLHFRFDKSGEEYHKGTIVDVQLSDGSHQQFKIEDTSARIESK